MFKNPLQVRQYISTLEQEGNQLQSLQDACNDKNS